MTPPTPEIDFRRLLADAAEAGEPFRPEHIAGLFFEVMPPSVPPRHQLQSSTAPAFAPPDPATLLDCPQATASAAAPPVPPRPEVLPVEPPEAALPAPDPHPFAAPGGDPDDDPAFAALVIEALDRLAPSGGIGLEPYQIPPAEHDDPDSEVTGWVLLAGRGTGKTYGGARWLHRRCSMYPGTRARIIAPSFADAVASCIEGPSGILAASNYQVQWKPSHPGGAQLRWANGSVAYVIGTPTPREVDRLRALTNIDVDWFEEAAANTQIVEVERQARLSRRRKGAKWIATTTPRPLKTIREWKKDPHVKVTSAVAHDNPHADPQWLEELERMYRGTRLYAQEVEGKVLEDVEGALWTADHLDRSRIHDLATMYEWLAETNRTITRAAVGVDPANSTGTTGIVAVLITDDRHLLVVEDASQLGRTAEQWARVAVDTALKWNAVLVPENDSGGDAIRAVLKAADLLDEVTIMPARARGQGGKGVRAEPVSLLWERDDFRGHMVGSHPLLEDQMTTYVPDMPGQDSPDRMDACVWACTYLWGRASFGDVTSRWPDLSNDQTTRTSAASRRPGAMIRWHRGLHSNKERSN